MAEEAREPGTTQEVLRPVEGSVVANAKCRGCGKSIVWGETKDGKKIPLDPRPPVYSVRKDPLSGTVLERALDCMVTHFATCPQASQFSASNKKQ